MDNSRAHDRGIHNSRTDCGKTDNGRTGYRPYLFADRRDAGRTLAAQVAALGLEAPVILGLARGGVIVAREIASALGAPLDVVVVRKIGAPLSPELGVGAVAPDGLVSIDADALMRLGIARGEMDEAVRAQAAETERQQRLYRGALPAADVAGKSVVLVDDGLATGVTARAAIAWVRKQRPGRIVLTVPVAAESTLSALDAEVDAIVCSHSLRNFHSVGACYRQFDQVSDKEVVEALSSPTINSHIVNIEAGAVRIQGDLSIAEGTRGVVIFAHGSGSSRFSPRSQFVANALHANNIATLIVDLHTEEEEEVTRRTGPYRLDIQLLSRRILAAARWLTEHEETRSLPIGLFGASTGAGAALVAAAGSDDICAVVSRGGRPDLAGDSLPYVPQATLLIVGGADPKVLALNETALRRLGAREKRLEIVAGATHLFEEPGALEAVAALTADWFSTWFAARSAEPPASPGATEE